MKARYAALVFLSLLLAFLTSSYQLVNAQAPPPLPALFNGNITLNGAPAPDGLNITAWDNVQVVGSALTSGGTYSLSACSPQNCNGGDTISFKLNSQLAATQMVTFDSSQRGIPQSLDLAFTGTIQHTTTSTTTSTSQSTTTTSSSSITSTSQEMTATSSTSSTSTSQSTTESTGHSMTTMSSNSSTTGPSSATSSTGSSTKYPTGPTCLIATATYGSELAPEVQLLRNFRDNSIMKTRSGSSFMVAFNAWYYSFSPYVANYLANHWVERTIMKGVLYPLIGMLFLSQGLFSVAGLHPEFAALLSGLLASSLIGTFYLGLPIGLLRARVRRLREWKVEGILEKLLGLILLGGMAALLIGEAEVLPVMLMISSATVVLSTLFLSAIFTSAKIGNRPQRG